ncbi:MAG: hypothetical protein N4A46_07645 [Schleiferiaceae bacterium]|jgi:adenylate cyclase|nr:hypothetical protein [Schleiferiaceae bacterium]
MSHLSKKQKDIITIFSVGIAFGFAYPLNSDGLEKAGPIINGFVIGLLGSGFIVLNEIIINKNWIRKMNFRALVAYKTLIYFSFFALLIPIVVSITRSMDLNLSLKEFVDQGHLDFFLFHDDYHIILLYALFGTLLFIFTYQMSRKMGQGVLFGFITGKYHKPREQKLITMFIDMNDSTNIAEKLGDEQFNLLLKNFFFDITDSITNNYGNIYRYVGDEIAITWKADNSFKSDLLANTFYQAKNALEARYGFYQRKFGLRPRFTAGCHYGKAIVGEIGEIKSQICILGQVMFETTAIEKSCKTFDAEFLMSDKLLRKYPINNTYEANHKGDVELNGKSINVFSIVPKDSL